MDVSLSDGWLLDATTWAWTPLPTMVSYLLSSNGTRRDLQDVVPGQRKFSLFSLLHFIC